MVAVAEWSRHKAEVPGLSCFFFPQHFLHIFFTPTVTVLLEYLDPVIHTYFFLLYNSVAEILLAFKLPKGTSTIIP